MNFSIKIKQSFKNNLFLRNTGILAGGILSGQIISIISSPIISRIYSPSDFGVLHVFLSIVSILTVISTLKFELAIPLPKNNLTAFYLLLISSFLSLFFSFFVLLFLYFFKFIIASLFDFEKISNYLFLIPVAIFFESFYGILNYWAIREKKFNIIAKTRLYQSILGISTQIGLGFLGLKPIGLLLGSIIKRASGFISLLKLVNKKFINNLTFEQFKFVVKRYKKFPLISNQSALLNVLGLNMPILLFASYYGTKKVGYFSLTLLIVNVPLTTLGRSLSQVFFSESSDLVKTDIKKLKRLYLKIIKNLLYIGIIPTIFLLLWAPIIFPFIFGNDWYLSGKITQILAVMYLIQFITVPTSQLLTVLENQEIQLVWDILRLIAVLGSIYIPYTNGSSFLESIFYYGIAMSVLYALLLLIQIISLNKLIRLAND